MNEVNELILADTKINLVEDGVEIVGDASYSVETGDAAVVISAVFAAGIKALSFTREEVLTKLYRNMAIAANIAGPNSDAVADFEADIEDVKSGGLLAPHAWMFELE